MTEMGKFGCHSHVYAVAAHHSLRDPAVTEKGWGEIKGEDIRFPLLAQNGTTLIIDPGKQQLRSFSIFLEYETASYVFNQDDRCHLGLEKRYWKLLNIVRRWHFEQAEVWSVYLRILAWSLKWRWRPHMLWVWYFCNVMHRTGKNIDYFYLPNFLLMKKNIFGKSRNNSPMHLFNFQSSKWCQPIQGLPFSFTVHTYLEFQFR